jgi:hypothetical protein
MPLGLLDLQDLPCCNLPLSSSRRPGLRNLRRRTWDIDTGRSLARCRHMGALWIERSTADLSPRENVRAVDRPALRRTDLEHVGAWSNERKCCSLRAGREIGFLAAVAQGYSWHRRIYATATIIDLPVIPGSKDYVYDAEIRRPSKKRSAGLA